MFGCMKLTRIISSLVVFLILTALILIGIPGATTVNYLSQSKNVKNWLDNGGIYENAVDFALKEALKEIDYEHVETKMFVSQEDLQNTIEQIVTPQFIQDSSETVIDSIYEWLDGTKDKIEFQLDFNSKREEVAEQLTTVFIERFDQMPTCSNNIVIDENFDPFASECVPVGYNVNEKSEEITKALLESEDFFNDVTFSSEDLKIEPKLLNSIKTAYGIFSKLPYIIYGILGLFSLILFLDVIGLSNRLIVTGGSWLLSGAALLFGGYYMKSNLSAVVDKVLARFNLTLDANLKTFLLDPLQFAVTDITGNMGQTSIIIVVIAMATVFAGLLIKFKGTTTVEMKNSEINKLEKELDQIPKNVPSSNLGIQKLEKKNNSSKQNIQQLKQSPINRNSKDKNIQPDTISKDEHDTASQIKKSPLNVVNTQTKQRSPTQTSPSLDAENNQNNQKQTSTEENLSSQNMNKPGETPPVKLS